MSRPSANASSITTPGPLQTSWLAGPFLVLAGLSANTLKDWAGKSQCINLALQAYRGFLSPIHQRLADWTWLHQGLKILHLLVTFVIFVLATFASTEVIGAATVFAYLLLNLRALARPLPVQLNMIDALVMLFFLTAFIATAFSSYVHTSVIGLAKFLIFFIGYCNFRILIGEDKRHLTWMLLALVLLGAGEALIGFYQYINHVQPLATWQDTSVNPEEQLTRIFGTLKPYNPNLLAGFLIPCVAAGVGLGFKYLFQRRWLWSVLLFLCTMPTLMALVLTGSRGGYLAILAMSVMTFLYLGHLLWHEPELKTRYKLKALWLLVLLGTIVAAIGALFFVAPIRSRFLSIFAMREDSSNSYRLNVWMRVIEMIKDNWLLGIGPGNDTFKQVYGLYMIPGYNALSAYCIFLEMWVEQGIVGLLLFLLLVITGLMRMVLAFYSGLSLEEKVTIGFLMTGVLGSVVYGLFDTIWYRPSVNLLFWLFVAGMAVYTERMFDSSVTHQEMSV